MRRRTTGLAALGGALLALLGAAPAHAGHRQQSFFQDDRLLTSNDPAQQADAVDKLSILGVDTIHTVVNWRRIAPAATSKAPPAGFDGSNPASYPPGAWDPYDNLVRLARARGIGVLMSPAGPVPDWASRCRVNVNKACRPNPAMFGQFVTAVAKRYSGSYVDEDQDQSVLPRVSRWSVWNEPNLGSWLYPQTVRAKHGRLSPVGAMYYRQLVYAASGALRRTGHAHDGFMVPDTAPIGGGATRTDPTDFLLQLFCLDSRGRPLRGKAAKQQGCVHAKPIPATGLTHHPYGRGASVPTGTKQRPGSLTIGVLGRFPPLLRELRHSKIGPHRQLGVYFTEFGVSTRPPDHKFGVPLDRQAQYVNEVDYLAYMQPWIRGVSQFQLSDDSGLIEKNTFQTGLTFANGAPKPSYAAYRIPIFVVLRGHSAYVFGQIRPQRGGMKRQLVQIQLKAKRKGWKTVATRRTEPRGFVYTRLRAQHGSWRLRWVEPNGTVSYSRPGGAVPPTTPSTPGLPPPGPGKPPQPPGLGGPETPPPASGDSGAPPPVVRYTLHLSVTNGLIGSGSVTSSPAGISCSAGGGACAADYDAGTTVTLTATPGTLSSFNGWGGDCAGAPGNTCTVPMSQARNVSASFGP